MPISSQSNVNPVLIWCRSIANLMPIWCQSCANRCRSSYEGHWNRPLLRLVACPYSTLVPWLLAQMSSDWRLIGLTFVDAYQCTADRCQSIFEHCSRYMCGRVVWGLWCDPFGIGLVKFRLWIGRLVLDFNWIGIFELDWYWIGIMAMDWYHTYELIEDW